MPVLRFRVYWEEEESIYRDILILAGQTFLQLHEAILQSFEFDQKHGATFFRSNDHWQRGREILLKADNQQRKPAVLLMGDTQLSDVVRNPNEKFVYVYESTRHWTFLVELISVAKESSKKTDYPVCARKEGSSPTQYGNHKAPVKDRMIETEEQYDLNNESQEEGFGEEGADMPDENTDAGGTEDLL